MTKSSDNYEDIFFFKLWHTKSYFCGTTILKSHLAWLNVVFLLLNFNACEMLKKTHKMNVFWCSITPITSAVVSFSFESWQLCLLSALIYSLWRATFASRDFPLRCGLLVLCVKAGGEYKPFGSYMWSPEASVASAYTPCVRVDSFVLWLTCEQVVILHCSTAPSFPFYSILCFCFSG